MAEPKDLPQEGKERTPEEVVKKHRAELSASGIRGLVGRVERGLDPSGMLAVSDTREVIEPVMTEAGIDMAKLKEFTTDLHLGGMWRNAEKLGQATDPEVKGWFLMADKSTDGQGKDGRDLTQEEYVADAAEKVKFFQDALGRAEDAIQAAINNRKELAESSFKIEDGVPVADTDAFLDMAIKGETGGVVVAGDLLFVGSNELDYDAVAQKHSLKKEDRFDERRQADTTFYVGKDGTEVKVLGPGFCIVFGKDMELAKDLARTGQEAAKKAEGEAS